MQCTLKSNTVFLFSPMGPFVVITFYYIRFFSDCSGLWFSKWMLVLEFVLHSGNYLYSAFGFQLSFLSSCHPLEFGGSNPPNSKWTTVLLHCCSLWGLPWTVEYKGFLVGSVLPNTLTTTAPTGGPSRSVHSCWMLATFKPVCEFRLTSLWKML